ncbi:zona pellucida sperm-binding protein 4-like [Dunckerocampus dactyliophorus]|uniref:zona pellucida sperm-binding protein 4-like n=1 Tax=Dunckerocampus dactyliophorus TaxID=161453 RepID=UPI0024068865|nr:zona pellucida sperm-binding protein 4-like [Dunckerocampus dactyliophorus]
MARLGVELLLLLVLTEYLLLVGARGWVWDDKTALFKGPRPLSDDEEDDGFGTSDDNDYYTDYTDPSIQVETLESHLEKLDGITDDGLQEEASPTGQTSPINQSHSGLQVACEDSGFRIHLRAGRLSDVKVLGMWLLHTNVCTAVHSQGTILSKLKSDLPYRVVGVQLTVDSSIDLLSYERDSTPSHFVRVQSTISWLSLGSKDLRPANPAQKACGLNVTRLQNTLTVPYTGCNVENTNNYSLQLMYVDELGQAQVATVTCDPSPSSNPDLIPRSGVKPTSASKCRTPPPMTVPKAQNCALASEEQLTCGQAGISSSACETMGCCVDSTTSKCFYPMDECTLDKHFVFIIYSEYASMSVDPTQLVIPGTSCKPVIVNAKFAIFKFKVTECGTHTYDIGVTRFYLVEVQTLIKALNLKYGIITRTDPLRYLIECRYSISSNAQQPLASVGYMVKIPNRNLPPSIHSGGLYGVQLRIATDESYSAFLPSFPTLRYILNKPVYFELSLWSPKPNAVVLVKYCLAYPRSAKNALVLVYEGCANPYDPNVSILEVNDSPRNRHRRRFVARTFQFMDTKTKKYLDEEILFMCSSEVCRPDETTCEERCFDGKVP